MSAAATRTLAGDGNPGHPHDSTDQHSNLYDKRAIFWPEGVRASPKIPRRVVGGGEASRFWRPEAVAVHPLVTTIAIADAYNNQIRAISLVTDDVVTIAGSGSSGITDGVGTAAEFSEPSGLAFNKDGTKLYVVC